MNPQLLPAQLRDDVPARAQTVVAFLAEKERRSGSRRTVESYARMLWPFLTTGRRRAEVIGLTAGDISIEGETAFYSYRGKGGKRGRRELPRPPYAALRAMLADARLALAAMDPSASLRQVGAGTRGGTSSTFYAHFRRYLRLAGLAPTGLHILRHTAAKLRRDAGPSIEAGPSFLDHSSIASTSVT